MLAVLHSLLVYQSLSGVYSDAYNWSVTDLIVAVGQSRTVACDLQSVDDATQILADVYATRCHNKHDAEKIRAFIFRLIRAWTTESDVIADFAVIYFTESDSNCVFGPFSVIFV